MDSFNNGSTSVANNSFNDAGGNNENEPNPEMAVRFRKQLPTKNFMSPTISTANKAAAPKKQILAERNETLDFVEQTSSKGLNFHDDDVEKDFVRKSSSQPYDPVKNYLSPRPKFLRYNPDRRRKMFAFHGNEEGVKRNNSFDGVNGNDNDIPSSELELGLGSPGSKDSCSLKEPVEETKDNIDEEGELEDEIEGEEEEEEEEIVEFKEDGWRNIKGLLKFLFAMIAVVLTTIAICSMNSPTLSHTLESLQSFNIYGVEHSNFSRVVQDLRREADLIVGRLKEEGFHHGYEGPSMVETFKELVDVQNAQINEEVENDEADVILDEMLSNQENTDKLKLIETSKDQEIVVATEVIKIDDIKAEIEVHDEPLTEDSKSDETNSQLKTGAHSEIVQEMENALEKEIDDTETNKKSIRSASFDLIIAAVIGLLMLVFTSFGVMYSNPSKPSSHVTMVAKANKVAKKEEIEDLEPSLNPSCLIQQIDKEPLKSASLQIDVSKEISHIYAPSVELLGEFVFEGDLTSSYKSCNISASNSLIQTTTVSSSEMKEASTVNSHTIKKQTRKKAEMSSIVTPSTVRRSSRLQNRRSAMSP